MSRCGCCGSEILPSRPFNEGIDFCSLCCAPKSDWDVEFAMAYRVVFPHDGDS